MGVSIGIDMGGTRIKIGLVREGVLLANSSIPASSHVNLDTRLVEIAEAVDQLLAAHDEEPLGVGLAFPGIVNSDEKKILSRYVKYPDAQQVDLSLWALQKWGVPLALENDARAALVGEWQYGAGQHCDNLVLIALGTGVGSAALINGKLLRGKHYLAGNLGGHMSINLHGDECNCGNTGCVESEASTWALQKNIRQFPDFHSSTLSAEHEVNFNIVFNHAAQGDPLATWIKENCLKAWSLAIINLIHAYDPERVVIGGGIMKSKDIIIPYVQKMIGKDSWIKDHRIGLVAAEQVEHAGILGMSYLTTSIKKEYKAIL